MQWRLFNLILPTLDTCDLKSDLLFVILIVHPNPLFLADQMRNESVYLVVVSSNNTSIISIYNHRRLSHRFFAYSRVAPCSPSAIVCSHLISHISASGAMWVLSLIHI